MMSTYSIYQDKASKAKRDCRNTNAYAVVSVDDRYLLELLKVDLGRNLRVHVYVFEKK